MASPTFLGCEGPLVLGFVSLRPVRARALSVRVEMEVSRSDEDEREGCSDEGRNSGDHEDPVQSGEERLSGGIG